MGTKINIYQQLILNTIPLFGYWFLHWSMFAIVYIYWVEAVIIAFFIAAKIMIARGNEMGCDFPDKPLQRVISGIKILIGRLGLMLFYWIFIFLFVAMGQGNITSDESMNNVKIIAMVDAGFNYAVLAFFLSQILDFMSKFIFTGAYKVMPSSEFKSIFDSRTIIIHVVIVLGTFASSFMLRYQHIHSKLPGLAFVVVLVVVKSLGDIVINSKFFKGLPVYNALSSLNKKNVTDSKD